MANTVLHFTSDDTGAPTLNNAAGSLINVLDACLINGFNSKSVTSLVVAGNVATVTASAHGYNIDRIVLIAGATPAGLNGRQQVLSATANTFTFATTGISDQTATGTITVKRAALDWVKEFSGTNKAVYKRSDVLATAMKLRVDDTGAGVASAMYARWTMVETATDVDTTTGLSPTAAQLSGGQYVPKGVNDSTAKKWILVGDSRTFYLFTDDASYTFSVYGTLKPSGFGDVISYRLSDTYKAFVASGSNTSGQNRGLNVNNLGLSFSNTRYDLMIARAANQIGVSVPGRCVGPSNADSAPGGIEFPVYPSPVDNGMLIQRNYYVSEYNATFNSPVRGEMPGLMLPLATFGTLLSGQKLIGIAGFSGVALVVTTGSQSAIGNILIDLTGPWQ